MPISRRAALAVPLLLPAAALWTPPARAFSLPPKIAFDVTRNGDPFGRHVVTFEQDGPLTIVEVDILLKVEAAFITLFRYRHQNREVWRDGRLEELVSQTDEDGKDLFVRAKATGASLQVESTGGKVEVPPDTIPSSYWNPATVEQTQLLNTQLGDLLAIQVVRGGSEPMLVNGAEVAARRFRLVAEIPVDVWYTLETNEWCGLRFKTQGSDIRYTRDDRLEPLAE